MARYRDGIVTIHHAAAERIPRLLLEFGGVNPELLFKTGPKRLKRPSRANEQEVYVETCKRFQVSWNGCW